ncbi:3 beta-hydroxysteroid dehydrogenase/Delta 5--_4-isomerase [Halomicronema hongdechloris C2206]|uniref:3 beta-hydroxysteroid dehydrogenase/Delta 5-->4-isomerase n=1 Tax=Halomicronema hongdechloris C2206 TaxID=1641165 RepID=A0A1Z3HSD8_9CYAN|nr:SDR family oxidoreductase [Halomicronema hongdechloris]ASC73230.1 3 beta-hydroxysteroid dehydrogenase/Delta 5-->4-isomerase [Halomicronema hongdechloris C2206]
MKLLIFGATGGVGRQLVDQALAQGHRVTAFARTPDKLAVQHPNLAVFQGDVMDLPTVQQAVQGQDAVICILGSGQKLTGTVRSQGTRHIVQAMEQSGIRRFICQTTLGAGESWGSLNVYWKTVMFGLILRNVFADHERQEQTVQNSHLDWTIVRPGAFVAGPRTGQYRHGFPGTDKSSQLKISRADVADFILQQLGSEAYLHQAASLSY